MSLIQATELGFIELRPDLTGTEIGTGIDFFPVPVVPSYALDVALHRRLATLMGLLDWEIDPDFPVGLAQLELHDTPQSTHALLL